MPIERISPRPDFDRRRKNDRTVDSICLHCCTTVAACSTDAELEAKEAGHFCWRKQEKLMRQRFLNKGNAA